MSNALRVGSPDANASVRQRALWPSPPSPRQPHELKTKGYAELIPARTVCGVMRHPPAGYLNWGGITKIAFLSKAMQPLSWLCLPCTASSWAGIRLGLSWRRTASFSFSLGIASRRPLLTALRQSKRLTAGHRLRAVSVEVPDQDSTPQG